MPCTAFLDCWSSAFGKNFDIVFADIIKMPIFAADKPHLKNNDIMGESKYIRFDWAMRRILRQKANYGILEGLLKTVLGMDVKIISVLEPSDESKCDCFNRVDLLALDSSNDTILIEVQNNTEYAYFERIIFGTSRFVTDLINKKGEGYENIRKIYSVNIVYFSLGKGTDIVYHGKTEFRGIHNGDLLELSPFQRQRFNVDAVSDLYPEYYILKVNDFNRVAKNSLEEWVYYLNTGDVPQGAKAPGMEEVKEQLTIDRMNKSERSAYYKHLDNIVILRDNIYTGREEGRLEGRIAERKENARKMKQLGLPVETISKVTGLPVADIESL